MEPVLAAGVLAAARRRPAAPAVIDDGRAYAYRELAAVSALVTRRLRDQGVRPGDAVAVRLPRSWPLVVTMLAIRRLGATVVPLDTHSPPERRRHVLADSGSVALVEDGPADAPVTGVRQLAAADLMRPAGDAPAAGAGAGEAGDAPVSFLFYTSGTTGQPKGVEVRDAGIMRLARPGYIRLAEGARYACLSSPAFDALSFEVWTPLLTGGCCVVLDDETVATPHRLDETLRRERIDTMFITAALFNAVTEAVPGCFASAGQVLVGGEPLNARVIRRWYASNPASATQLYNGYGPTEATTFTLVYPIPRDFDSSAVPIGWPLPGTEALAVADGARLAAPGEVAELYIGGEGVAAGYRNLPAETARRFVRLPWHDGGAGRYYRSGDLVRTGARGLVEYVGRADRQVKVRGFRIEPDEVERQLTAHPAVRQAYVCARRDPAGDRHELLAYLVTDDGLSYAALERHLAATLPPYMRPHRLYRVGALPRTANGKVDGDALLARDDPPWRPGQRGGPGEAGSPATAWQREVLGLAGDVLGVAGSRLSPGDTFIAAGGDSLASLRLRFAIRKRWGCELPQATVLRSDLAGLAAAIAVARPVPGGLYPAPAGPAGARSAPATSEQQRLWLLQQQDPRSTAYNVGLVFRLTGPVNERALRDAVRGLVERHPALRTAFQATPGGLRQAAGERYDPWIEADGSGDWAAFARRLFAIPFDLSRPRLLRACWRPDDSGGILFLHLHHIAVDGWSLTLLLRELSARYAGEEVTGAAPTPLDYAAWQAGWSGQPEYLALRAALRDHYAAVEEAAEPLRPVRADGLAAGPSGQILVAPIDAARRAALGRLGARLGLTLYELLLAVFSWSVYGVTGRTRPRVASPVAGRPVREFEASIGMFANTVLVPLRVTPAGRLRALLQRQAADVRAVLERQDVALADVLDDHDFRTGGPLFDFMFVLDNTDFGALRLPGCDAAPVWLAPAAAKCPLTLSVAERGDGFDCLWEYDGGYFDAAEVEAMAALFRSGLDGLLAEPDPALDDLVAPYREGLPCPGRAAGLPLAYTTIADGFARQVRRTPAATALADGDRTVTYAELDAYAATLAGELQARFPLPDGSRPCHVALRLDPSVEHVAALLALARLNVTAVPLDPAYPPALLRQILDQVAPACVLVSPGEAAGDGGIPHHRVVLAAAAVADQPAPPHDAQRPLYALFTSGSTGTPKGVQVPDRTLCNLLQWQAAAGGLPAGAVTQQFSMLSFDVSFQEIFGTLCGGGTLHLIRPGWRHDMPALLHQLETAGIERIHMPYVALQLLAGHGRRLGRYPSRLRDVITAGEQLLCTDAIRGWFSGLPGARLFNHYGPAETHVVSALCLDGDPAGWPDRPAVGGPVAGAWLRVVDEAGLPAPPDCPGDLLIGGLPAVPCYLNDPALNESRFVELPGTGRFYRSGDRARFDRQGRLHYLGRHDEQVKVSGHRLELGQVEAALATHPAVVAAAVVLDGGHLVACVEFRDDPPPPEELAVHLAARLPAYVRVDRFRRVAALPRTASGKLNRRRALDAPGEELRPRPAVASALTPREAQLTALFEAVIGRPIAPGQRFFDAGASSLGLMRFHLRATAELGLTLSISDLFEHVTPRDLARFLDRGPARQAPDGQAAAGEPIAIVGMAVRLPGADDLAAFWDMVTGGRRGISYFDAADGLVGARSQMSGLLAFDPEHFGIGRQEARLMDPQQRHLLMACVQALAHAGLAGADGRRIGLVASCGENTYFQAMLREGDPAQLPGTFQMALQHDKDFLATKAAYHLGFTGPAFTVQAACASSLVAVHVAAGLLRQGDAEIMLAGGVLVDTLLTRGYRYRPQHIFSRDGHCRPFSDDASGTIGASGVGVVVLKPLSLARRDGDTVYALVTGSAVNNDGAGKLSYTAPGLAGQREVIQAALRRSGRTAADLGYVEAHGTGTELGDPVEVAALRQAYDLPPGAGRIALASVKSQIGHLGAAAGVAGLIRAALAVYHGRIPPNIDFRRLNPRIAADAAPFLIPPRSRPWPAGRPRVAAVSSFGIGGTNAHVVIEADEPAAAPAGPVPAGMTVPCLMLSASSPAALRADAARIADYLAAHPERYPQVLRHLQAGRPAHRFRVAAACAGAPAAVAWLLTAAGAPAAVTPAGEERAAQGADPAGLAAAWLAGTAIGWLPGPAQAPWDFPPPAFSLAGYDFVRAAPAAATGPWPGRRPEAEWMHQPQWVRVRRAAPPAGSRAAGVLVVMAAGETGPATLRPFEGRYARLVRVVAGAAFARLGDDAYQADPADPGSIERLLDAVAEPGVRSVDWLHALPLAVDGPVGAGSLARARWASLDTPAALLRAAGGRPGLPAVRVWWLSHRAQPVDGPVDRPELGLLAGVTEVGPQECGIDGHWLDLPGTDPAGWAAPVAGLLEAAGPASEAAATPRRLALRHGYWWQQIPLPLATPGLGPATGPELPAGPGAHLVLGGTGGIGSTIAGWLLEHSDGRVVLVARRPHLPPSLGRQAGRVDLVRADLATEPVEIVAGRIGQAAGRLDSVVHAAGVAAGGLIARRDPVAAAAATAAKLNGALLVEHLIARHRPALALYCSSMSAQLGGAGQLDYAAANGALDGFARYQAEDNETTLRLGIDWDVWREAGMARHALHDNARHQAHLAVGLTLEEARRVLDRAWRQQLPQILVSTTSIERSAVFYAPGAAVPGPAEPGPAEPGPAGSSLAVPGPAEPGPAAGTPMATMAGHLAGCLRRWLGLDELDPAASLYDLGADSLTLLDLIAEVKERTGTDLTLSQLSHQVSLSEVLTLLGETDAPEAAVDPLTVEVWREGTGSTVLCLVHPVGGDVLAYRPLVAALDDRLTVCLIADPALHRPEMPGLSPWTIAERAQHYHAALRARFPPGEWRWRLAGWSFGAWVAIAMAAEAEAAGRPADEVYLLDPPSPDAGARLGAYDGAQLEAVFARELAHGGMTEAGPQARAYAERLARCGRANLASMASYTPPALAATPARLWLAGRATAGLPAPEAPDAQGRRWRARLPRLAGWQVLDATHDDVVRPPHVHAVAGAISTASPPVLAAG